MPKQKLYCYVDETGQDTQGRIFIVVAIVVSSERDAIETFLAGKEKTSGKGKRKWIKAREKERDSYLESALQTSALQESLFYHVQKDTKAYEAQTIITVEQAIKQYAILHKLASYKATIVIDGLSRKVAERVGVSLRKAGIPIRKVRGLQDESNAILRFADSLAGMIREAEEGSTHYMHLEQKLEKENLLKEV